MKKVLGLLLVLALMTSACGDDGGNTDPAAAKSCDELTDVLFNLMQEAIDSVADMSLADFMDTAQSDMPAAISRLETMGDELQARAEVLECSDVEAQAAFCSRIGELRADSELAQLLVSGPGGNC